MTITKTVLISSLCWAVIFPALISAWLILVPFKLYLEMDLLVSPSRIFLSVFLPFLCSLIAIRKKSLDFAGIVSAIFVGSILTLSNYAFISMLMVFFFTSTKLTKFRSELKSNQDADSNKKPRSCANVLCNSAPAVVFAILYSLEAGCCEININLSSPHLFARSCMSLAVLGSMSCSCADTWASEIGSVFNTETTRLIINGRKVPAGTNGGVTVIGLLCSVAGGATMGLVFASINWIFAAEQIFQPSLILTGAVCGILGSVVDSLLGATLQYSGFNIETKQVVSVPGPSVVHVSGENLLNNHAVNLLSTLFTSLITPFVYLAIISTGLFTC